MTQKVVFNPNFSVILFEQIEPLSVSSRHLVIPNIDLILVDWQSGAVFIFVCYRNAIELLEPSSCLYLFLRGIAVHQA